jgi:hypothetical protein
MYCASILAKLPGSDIDPHVALKRLTAVLERAGTHAAPTSFVIATILLTRRHCRRAIARALQAAPVQEKSHGPKYSNDC